MTVYILLACMTPWPSAEFADDCKIISVHRELMTAMVRQYDYCDGETTCRRRTYILPKKVER